MFTGGGYLGKAAAAAVVASLLTFGGLTYSPVMAADTTPGQGDGVAIGTGSNAPKAENVAIGKGAEIKYSNGASSATGDVIVGSGAVIDNYASQGGSIAIGKNAKVENMAGGGEASFAFGQTTYSGSQWSPSRIPADPAKVIGSIAIGDNTFARTGSTMIGSHNYTGDLGDTKVDSASTRTDALNVYATTIGANSFSNGAFTTSTGVYNIISSEYNGGRAANPVKNLGATINGALNSIESKTADSYYSGIANTVSGIANRMFNANGSLIYGAGNEITNSFTDLSGVPTDSGASAKEFAEKLRTTIKESESGGSALAIGGGNTIDRSIRSQVIGVNNKLTGNTYHKDLYLDDSWNYHPAVDGVSSQYNMIDGYNNTAQNVNHAYVIGANNIIQGKKFSDATKNGVLNDADWEKSQQDDNLIVIGDNHTLANDVSNDIILGTADEILTTSVSDIVMMGHNADVQTNNGVAIGSGAIVKKEAGVGGVAIGSGSIANVGAGQQGYYVKHDQRSEEGQGYPFKNNDSAWISRAGAVSVGDTTNEDQSKWITRQITGVAAGTNDTDAVNVAQLKSAQIHYYSVKVTQEGAEGDKSNYNNDGATGEGSIAIGPFASAEGNHSLALGYGAQTTHSDVLDEKKNMDDNTAVGYNSQAGYRSTALGYKSQATGRYAVALGTDALAEKDNSTAVGMNAQATGKQATALGSLAKASGESATAVGEGANALADNSSAVGQGAIVEEGASKGTALGYQAKVLKDAENSIALGASSQVSGANSIAIGMSAQVSSAKSVAIGQDAKVSVENSVALGQGSVASGNLNDYNVMSLTIPNLGSSYNVSGGYPSGIVSVGNDKVVRTITNVAAGRVTPTSTDAVNGSELYDVATEAAKHATVKAAANSRITVDNKGVNKGKGIEYTIGLNTEGLATLTAGLTFAGDDGQSDNSKIISRKLKEQLNIIGGATDTVEAANIGVVKKDDNTLNIRLAQNITGLTSLQATTITSGNVTVNGTDNVITGLSNTEWNEGQNYSYSTKAATEAQLQKAIKQATADANDTHIKAGDYAVGTITDKNGQSVQGVSMDVVDKTGKVGTVRITDVAKASDVGDVTNLNADIKNATGKTTVVDAVNHVDNKVGNLDYSSTKYVTKGESVTTSIGKLDEAIKNASEAAGKHTIVSTKDSNLSVENIAPKGEAANYQISMSKDLKVDSVTAAKKITTKDLEVTDSATIGKVTINKDDKGTIGGLTNKTWDAKNITSGQAATEDQLQAATKNAVNYDGDDSKTVTLREDTTIKNVANTTIEEGSKNAVNAGTVYKETRVEKDGIFIRQANTAGENITALDHQVAANTESIYHINNRVSDLDNRVNKVGAGAAALAALHPLDFDPDDKWDFAVGYGNYRNANSVAFGAFYRPNEDTMFSLGTNFGNGENMFNAGLSFKIGQGGSGITTSKTAMAKTISSLKDTVHKQDQKIEGLENVVDTQDKKIAELEALVKEQGEMIRQYVGKK